MNNRARNGFKSKYGKNNKSTSDPEEDRRFEELRRKYANAIGFLLVKNVKQSELRSYFEGSDENKRRYASVKKFRQDIIDARPRAKQWVDKAFYVGLKLGEPIDKEDGTVSTPIVLGDCMFKQTTSVVSGKEELDNYIETIAKIIDSERIWNDPDMADFDTGEREDTGTKIQKKVKKTMQQEEDEGLKMESEGDMHMEEHATEGDTNKSVVSSEESLTGSVVTTRSRVKTINATQQQAYI